MVEIIKKEYGYQIKINKDYAWVYYTLDKRYCHICIGRFIYTNVPKCRNCKTALPDFVELAMKLGL
jgi:hypothetical protein